MPFDKKTTGGNPKSKDKKYSRSPITEKQLLVDGQIVLFRRGNDNWMWRARLGKGKKNKWYQFSTKTKDKSQAIDKAVTEWSGKRVRVRKSLPLEDKSFKSVADRVINWQKLRVENKEVVSKSHVKDFEVHIRWLERYFWKETAKNPVPSNHKGLGINISDITENHIEHYRQWRKQQPKKRGELYTRDEPVLDKTVAGDFIALKQMLKFAKREGWIAEIPLFPKLKVENRYRSWFSHEEYKKLMKSANAHIREAKKIKDPRLTRYREDLKDWILFLAHSGLRVSEALVLKTKNCRVMREGQNAKDYMLIDVVAGTKNTGSREALGLFGAVRAFRRMVERHKKKPEDLLFHENPRWRMSELLRKTKGVNTENLKYDREGRRRDSLSLRHSFIVFRMLFGKLDVFTLAKICGTSVHIISKHYGQHLTARMKVAEIINYEKMVDEETKEDVEYA